MLITIYLSSIILANLLVVRFGTVVTVPVAFALIGLDLTCRDLLHERWSHSRLWLKMLALIATGSILSYLLNRNAGPIALASFAAFAGAGTADTTMYWLLGDKARLVKINGSNVIGAGVDSVLFPAIAFGFPLLWPVMVGQFIAKIAGGFIWSLILVNVRAVRARDLGQI